jgi:teichuronic acid biosynthesis glycosyltransferase TuaC
LLELLKSPGIEAKVVAPVPWFPFEHKRFGAYGALARTPRREVRSGVDVYHPRYAMVPGVGMYLQPLALARAGARQLVALRGGGFDCDVIDAHYFYPDGVAAALIARRFAKPLVITARGSDINLLANLPYPRRLIVWAAKQARAIITVSSALKQSITRLDIDAERIVVLRNGVDLDVFRPVPQQVARESLGIVDGRLLLSVGNLVPEKGHGLAIEALHLLPDTRLAIVGEGPDRKDLEQRAERLGVSDRVTFLPVRLQSELKWLYSAADVLILASTREGWPNVLLEAMACGTPVVAANVGGVPEIITEIAAGKVVSERTASAFAAAVRAVLDAGISREATREFAQSFDWGPTSRGQSRVFASVMADRRGTL